MARITIRSDGNGGAVVIGTPPVDNGFFEFALGKVLAGKVTEISWEPIKGLGESREEMPGKRDKLKQLLMQKGYGLEGATIAADHLAANGVTIPTLCKDCAVPHNKWTGCPNLKGLVTPPDFYCAFGERKEGE